MVHSKGFTGKYVFSLIVALGLAALLAGCGAPPDTASSKNSLSSLLEKGIKPNEFGMVMVLEYHRISDNESEYTRSIKNFKEDLQLLYDKGYCLVSFHDLMEGKIDIPPGKSPVVFTFDDSTEGQFRYIKQGGKTVIDPQCALGMMKEFSQKHPDFGYCGLFNVLPTLFEQDSYVKKKLDYLVKNGFEIGNHTWSHPSLGKLDDESVKKEIATLQKRVKSLCPQAGIDILCLPHGSTPKNRELMFHGSYDRITYKNKWALLVGSNPMYPQYHYKNPGNLIPRIQVMDYDPKDGSGLEGSAYWLEFFDKHPELRYISDGNPSTICAPFYMRHRLLPDKIPAGMSFCGY